MNSNTTWRLFLLALGLFAFIYFVERRDKMPAVVAQHQVFPRLVPLSINAVEVHTSNVTVRAERTNDTWRLTTPAYPAQVTPIENFVAALLGAEKQGVINSSEVAGKLKDFGLDPPLANFSLSSGSNRFHLHIGSR